MIRRIKPKRPCDQCGKKFTVTREQRRFCTDDCRIRWHNERNARLLQEIKRNRIAL